MIKNCSPVEMTRLLPDRGSDVNDVDRDGNNITHLADYYLKLLFLSGSIYAYNTLLNPSFKLALAFIFRGYRIDQLNNAGETRVDVCCNRGISETIFLRVYYLSSFLYRFFKYISELSI